MSRVETIGRWLCEQCGMRFDRERSGARPIRFCGQVCYHTWNRSNGTGGGRFVSGSEPWNKGVKGLHLSPATEFKPGRASEKHVPVGTVSIRKKKTERHLRAFIKVAEPNVWLPRAVHVWQQVNGLLPKGRVIHHCDRDALNDDISNLQCLTRAEHAREHAQEIWAIRRST